MNDGTHNGLQVGTVVTVPSAGSRMVGTVADFHHGQVLVDGHWYFADEVEVIGQSMPQVWEVA